MRTDGTAASNVADSTRDARSSAGLSAGKLRALTTLADDDGVFRMVAVDQRPPLFAALARHGDRQQSELGFEEIADAKRMLVRTLAPACGAILLDPVWSHPGALLDVPGRTAIISTLEDYGFTTDERGERRSRLIEGWSVAQAKRSGASAVKVLCWYRPDATRATLDAQEAMVMAVGEACADNDLPFILEPLVYPLAGEEAGSAAYHRARPELVLETVRRLAEPRFGVDLYKLEFPAVLRHCAEFCEGAFDGVRRPALFALADVQATLSALDEACPAPWVLLSAGVGRREFEVDLDLAFEAGASGFLAGRTVWLDAFDAYPDRGAVETALREDGLPYLDVLAARAEKALPWREHRSFGGALRLEDAGEGWHARYGRQGRGA